MTPTKLKSYFENLSTLHKAIGHKPKEKHFFADLNELSDKIKNGGISPLVIMGPPEFEPVDSKNDNIQERNVCSLLFLKYVKPRGEDTAAIFAAYDECKGYAEDYISRIKHDVSESESIAYTDLNQYRIEPVGPIMDNYHGVELTIEFYDDEIDLTFKAIKWNG